jgi:diguanylate cyclase (GGDEF)-like protein/PAS domain S-box-containing protein
MHFNNQSVLDSLIDQIAVLDKEGEIIAINKAWINFSKENGGDLSRCGIGNNYLTVCQEEVRSGILQVFQGSVNHFTFEYPCHSDREMRWFLLRATPIAINQNGNNGVVVSHVNITDRKLAELQLKRNEERYRLIAENSTDFISVHTIEGMYVYVSPISRSLFGYKPTELLNQSAFDFFHPDDMDEIKSSYNKMLSSEGIQTVAYRFLRKDGKFIWLETKSQKVLSTEGKSEEIICISRDITNHKRKIKKLEKTIYTDELTGLYNRRFFNLKLNEEGKQNGQIEKPLSLLVIDIDYFKKYNDTYGHQKGDDCLTLVAQALKNNVRETDPVCRIGGEEFCVILSNTRKEIALSIAENLCKKIEGLKIPHKASNVSKYVTISIGVTTISGTDFTQIDQNELFSLADQALYKAKESGRNQVNHLCLIEEGKYEV